MDAAVSLSRMTIRLDPAVLRNLDRVVVHLDAACPAAEVTHASVAREILRHAVTHAEILRAVGADPLRVLADR